MVNDDQLSRVFKKLKTKGFAYCTRKMRYMQIWVNDVYLLKVNSSTHFDT